MPNIAAPSEVQGKRQVVGAAAIVWADYSVLIFVMLDEGV